MKNKLNIISEKYKDEMVKLASELIKIESMSGNEKKVAEFTAQKMKELGYDEVYFDKAGGVVGRIKGTGGGKTVMFNCHLDVVSEGNLSLWKYPPFSGEVVDGEIWGRGASDTKGTFSTQIIAAAALKKENMLPKGDILVTGVVHEEDSGVGSIVLLKELKADYAIVGEATENNIAIGNRGRMRLDIHATGKSVHASVPEQGINPHKFISKFIDLLDTLEVGKEEFLGKSSFAPTLIRSTDKSTNITPSEIILTLDYRNVNIDTFEEIEKNLKKLIDKSAVDGVKVEIERVKTNIKCYTGLSMDAFEGEPSFGIDSTHELCERANSALNNVLNKKVEKIVWNFATDCGHFTDAGIPTIGFSPADARMCHTTEDRISINMMQEALIGNMALIIELCN